jgi:hypothetical protein
MKQVSALTHGKDQLQNTVTNARDHAPVEPEYVPAMQNVHSETPAKRERAGRGRAKAAPKLA